MDSNRHTNRYQGTRREKRTVETRKYAGHVLEKSRESQKVDADIQD